MIIVYSTFSNKEEARRIAETLVERRLVACANILNGHEALYYWDGGVQREDEVAVIFKTRPELYQDVEKTIQSLHSYDVPCVVSWDIERGLPEFLDWIKVETT